jgi:6-pyruvoyltetrahydropterin/6-carboxytetrahydropterin synthase
MPFRIAKRFVVETGHLLTKHPGACRFPHGHSRTIEIVVSAAHLDANDMVCDFKALKHAAADVVARYDHAFALNTADPQFATLRASYGERVLGFVGADPTSELLAREIFRAVRERIAASLRPEVQLERVRVTETETSWAEYWE